MPLGKSGKHYFNPKVMQQKEGGEMPVHEQSGMMAEHEGHPKAIHGHFHEDGSAHTHIHHADDSHEHMDHGSHEEAHEHMKGAMGDGEESFKDWAEEESEEPEHKLSMGKIHGSSSGAY